jgi:hypothetical protein
MPPEKREHQWAITLIRQRGKFLGFVSAPDHRQKRLIAQQSD